ncbi:MAG: hypothetical protein H6830_12450 [Planctomycetes bacterium]|nr:hypothetical protein [Planctomycetota bacterium]HPF12861.1 hypothetical protein [Planctomycetota bacterium]HRV80551.1 hypothetical protein [Planctomycetota bacterium]
MNLLVPLATTLLALAPGFPMTQESDNPQQVQAELRAKLTEVQSRLAVEQAHMDSMISDLEDLRKERQSLEQSKLELRQTNSVLQDRIATIQQEFSQLQSQNNELKKQVERFGAAGSRMESRLTSVLYTAQFADANELVQVASEGFGQDVWYYIDNIPSPFQQANFDKRARRRFTAVDRTNSIIITDFPADIDRALEFLRKLDTQAEVNASRASGPGGYQVYESLSLDPQQIAEVLQYTSVTVDPIPQSSAVLLTGSPQELTSATQLLEVADRPVPQVQLSAWLVSSQGVWDKLNDPDSKREMKALPTELYQGLKSLLPDASYGELASMTVRSSARSMDRIQAQVQPGIDGILSWELETRIDGFQPKTLSLGLNECTVRVNYASGFTDVLTLNLVLTEGEYAAIGSIQGGQVYVVLSFQSK